MIKKNSESELAALSACEERNLQKLMSIVPKTVNANIKIHIYHKHGIKMNDLSLLHVACFSGAYDCVKFLIECHADINSIDVFNLIFINSIPFLFIWFNFFNFYKVFFFFKKIFIGHVFI